jgi:hypothetical protein
VQNARYSDQGRYDEKIGYADCFFDSLRHSSPKCEGTVVMDGRTLWDTVGKRVRPRHHMKLHVHAPSCVRSTGRLGEGSPWLTYLAS